MPAKSLLQISLLASTLALAACGNKDDGNRAKDGEGYCTSASVDSYNNAQRTLKSWLNRQATVDQAAQACTDFHSVIGEQFCKAGNQTQGGEMNVSYARLQEYCDLALQRSPGQSSGGRPLRGGIPAGTAETANSNLHGLKTLEIVVVSGSVFTEFFRTSQLNMQRGQLLTNEQLDTGKSFCYTVRGSRGYEARQGDRIRITSIEVKGTKATLISQEGKILCNLRGSKTWTVQGFAAVLGETGALRLNGAH